MTLSIELSAENLARLRAEADTRGMTTDELIAEMIAALPGDAAQNTLAAFIGAGASEAGSSHQIDELLSDGFGRD